MRGTVDNNDLAELVRKPSDLLRYRQWVYEITQEFGTITDYLCKKRLKWDPLPSSNPETGPLFEYVDATPFANKQDYKILLNDWPYGMETGIHHIVIWMKNKLPIQGPEGDLTAESRKMINDFVRRTFTEDLPHGEEREDKIMWFKNWAGLQSVRGIEHVHVLARDIPQDILHDWISEPRIET